MVSGVASLTPKITALAGFIGMERPEQILAELVDRDRTRQAKADVRGAHFDPGLAV